MARSVKVQIAAEVVDHDHDHWCNRCLLSTGVRAFLAVEVGGAMRLDEVLFCAECHGRDVTATDEPRRCSR